MLSAWSDLERELLAFFFFFFLICVCEQCGGEVANVSISKINI